VPAGTWHVIADGVIIEPVDLTFELILRRGDRDLSLVTWQQHFDAKPNNDFTATAYEVDEPAPAIDWASGDRLVYRYTGSDSAQDAYFPAADGTSGRDTQLTLPKDPP
jgi:hypothetical protein